MKSATVLFVGDIFGAPGIEMFKNQLNILRKNYNFDLIIVQAENITGRKGLNKRDYLYLKVLGVNQDKKINTKVLVFLSWFKPDAFLKLPYQTVKLGKNDWKLNKVSIKTLTLFNMKQC